MRIQWFLIATLTSLLMWSAFYRIAVSWPVDTFSKIPAATHIKQPMGAILTVVWESHVAPAVVERKVLTRPPNDDDPVVTGRSLKGIGSEPITSCQHGSTSVSSKGAHFGPGEKVATSPGSTVIRLRLLMDCRLIQRQS